MGACNPFARASEAVVSAQASPAHSKFRPKVPFDDDDDDDEDNDFLPPKPKSAKDNALGESAKNNALGESAKSNALGESESERTNVETHRRSPKKGSPKEHLSVDDDDEGDALPTEVASPKQPQSKAMKTLKVPQHLKLAARSTPTKELAKDVIELGNDDEDLSRIQRRSKRTKAN